ncbi:MAG: hypothetical protein ABWK05_03530 [Pyrobaculum sp.]
MECDYVVEYLNERGLKTERRGVEFVIGCTGSLKIGVWCPRADFPDFHDVEDARKALELDSLDVLIVVAYRPYVIVDFLNSLMEGGRRWYGVEFKTKLIGVSSVDLEVGLEEALGRAFVERPHKLGEGADTHTVCPQCLKGELWLYRQQRFFSRKYRGRVVEGIYACAVCGFRIRRLELLD